MGRRIRESALGLALAGGAALTAAGCGPGGAMLAASGDPAAQIIGVGMMAANEDDKAAEQSDAIRSLGQGKAGLYEGAKNEYEYYGADIPLDPDERRIQYQYPYLSDYQVKRYCRLKKEGFTPEKGYTEKEVLNSLYLSEYQRRIMNELTPEQIAKEYANVRKGLE